MTRVDCPCCHGVTYLLVYDRIPIRGGERFITPPTPMQCCHCQGEGTIPAEVAEEDQ